MEEVNTFMGFIVPPITVPDESRDGECERRSCDHINCDDCVFGQNEAVFEFWKDSQA